MKVSGYAFNVGRGYCWIEQKMMGFKRAVVFDVKLVCSGP